jgi:Mn-dependent DtxR family transcriptional regulator
VEKDPTEKVLRFIGDNIESVPHLEALVLLWENRSQRFGATDIAARIYVSTEAAAGILRDLQQRKWIVAESEGAYRYDDKWDETGDFMAQVVATYRRNLVRVATLLHKKASRGIREFARAFERKEDS